MSRIYKSENRGVTYQGSARSIGFNPRQAADDSKKTQQLKQAIVADGETKSREIQRVQRAENTILQAQQEVDRSSQRIDQLVAKNNLELTQSTAKGDFTNNQLFDQNLLKSEQTYDINVLKGEQTAQNLAMKLDASHQQLSNQVSNTKTQLIGTTINSLLSFAGSAVKYQAAKAQAVEAAEIKAQQEMEIKFQNSALLGDNFFGGQDTTPEVATVSTANTAGATAEAQELGNIANDVQSGGTAEDGFVAEQIRGMGSWSQTSDSRQNVYAARTQYPAFLAEAQANGLIRPGSQGMEDIQRLTQKFAKASGLHLADPKLVAEVFSRSALGTAQNSLTAVTNQAASELKAAREGQVTSNISADVDSLGGESSTQELGELWERANTENVNGVHMGRRSMASNRDTTEKVLRELAAEGKPGQIDRLRGYEYNSSRKGATLGGDMDDLFDKYRTQAQTNATSNFNAIQTEKALRVKQAVMGYMDNPSAETRQQAVTALRQIGSVEALAEADRISTNGMNIDPGMELELRQRTANGNPPTPAEIRTLLDQKIITAETAAKYLETPEQKAATKAVKGYSSGVSAGLKQAMLGTLKSSDLDTNMQGQWTIRHQMMMRELNDMVSAEVVANPSIAEDPQRLAQTFDKASKFLLGQDRYQISDTAGSAGRGFKAPIVSDTNLAIITTTQGNQDWSGYSAEQIFSGGTFPRSEMQAGKDTFIPIDSLKSDVKSIMEGGQPSNRTRLIAKNLGLSPRALVEEQLKLQGLPSVRFMQNLETSTVAPAAGTDLNMKTGFNALQSLGVPRRGAAYLAGNIQQESAWNGTRQWGGVYNPSTGAMDGTSRNGGLVSWASWSNDPARLGRVERYFGRNIAQITETEQLNYMLNVEMKNSYPQAYAVFMNPNSNAAALKKASYQYWRFGYQGGRYSFAEQLLAGG